MSKSFERAWLQPCRQNPLHKRLLAAEGRASGTSRIARGLVAVPLVDARRSALAVQFGEERFFLQPIAGP